MSVDALRFFDSGGFVEAALGSVFAAPPDKQHGVTVIVEGLGQLGPMPWPERGTTLPASGDPALCLKAQNASWWVVAWWPASYEQGIA